MLLPLVLQDILKAANQRDPVRSHYSPVDPGKVKVIALVCLSTAWCDQHGILPQSPHEFSDLVFFVSNYSLSLGHYVCTSLLLFLEHTEGTKTLASDSCHSLHLECSSLRQHCGSLSSCHLAEI